MERAAAQVRGWARLGGRAAGGLLLLAVGCLVTDHPEYSEANVPANLVRVAPKADFERAMGDPQACGGTGTSSTRLWMPFSVEVSDANVDDELLARIFVNGKWLSDRNASIPKTGSVERGELVMCAGQDDLDGPCSLVEIRVTRQFADNNQSANHYAPADPDDIASERWWVFGESADEPEALPEDCAEKERLDAGIVQ